jgi:hypothetical protein
MLKDIKIKLILLISGLILSATSFGQKNSPLRIQLSGVNYAAFTEPEEQLLIEKMIWKELYKNDANFFLDQWFAESQKNIGLQKALELSEKEVAKLNNTVQTADHKINNLTDNYTELAVRYEKELQRKKNWRNKGIPLFICIGFAGGYYLNSVK